MKARDVMTRDVVTITPETSVEAIATLLLGRGVSAVPVIDEQSRVVGIVSEGDLLRRPEIGVERRRSWWLELITDTETMAREYVKTHGLKAKDIMTRRVVSVTEEASLDRVADLIEDKRIKRVPVVKDGKLVGVVSRADIVRAFARGATRAGGAADDKTIRSALESRIRSEPWTNSVFLNVTVENGTVELGGMVESDDQRRALKVLAESVPGVKRVEDHLVRRSFAAYAT